VLVNGRSTVACGGASQHARRDATALPQAERLAGRLQATIEAPLEIAGQQIDVRGNIGVGIWQRGQSADELLHAADTAMYAAKHADALRHGLSVVS